MFDQYVGSFPVSKGDVEVVLTEGDKGAFTVEMTWPEGSKAPKAEFKGVLVDDGFVQVVSINGVPATVTLQKTGSMFAMRIEAPGTKAVELKLQGKYRWAVGAGIAAAGIAAIVGVSYAMGKI